MANDIFQVIGYGAVIYSIAALIWLLLGIVGMFVPSAGVSRFGMRFALLRKWYTRVMIATSVLIVLLAVWVLWETRGQ